MPSRCVLNVSKGDVTTRIESPVLTRRTRRRGGEAKEELFALKKGEMRSSRF